MKQHSYSIGEAAKATEVTAHTLRYYEKIQLLTNIHKNASGQRQYQAEDIKRIQFIKHAQAMQFSLEEIKQLILLDQMAAISKPEARGMVKEKLSLIEERLQELSLLKTHLQQLLNACEHRNQDEKCPILEGMKHEKD